MDIASNVSSLLCFALDCFDRIQLAREFTTQFEAYQLKLDIMQMRLSRWGDVAGVTRTSVDAQGPRPRVAAATGGTEDARQEMLQRAAGILKVIQDTLTRAKQYAECMRPSPSSGDDQILDPQQHVPNDLKKIRVKFQDCLRKRRAELKKAFEATKWAFYKKRNFDNFIEDMCELVQGLEDLFPEDTKGKLLELSREECKDFNRPNLLGLAGVLENCDPWLKVAIDEKLQAAGQRSPPTAITQSYIYGMATGIHNGEVKGVSNGAGHHVIHHW